MTLERWEKVSEWPLMIASILFLFSYSLQVLAAGPEVSAISQAIVIITWAIFAVDYLVSLAMAPKRVSWFVRHLPDLAIVALPALRPLRLLRLVTLLAVLQKVAGNALRGRVVTYVVSASALLIYMAALAMYDAERSAVGATILSFGDAIWWAFTTITTVGYGDLSPVTATGRIIAVGLMIGGITLLGIVTATLASWLVEKVSEQDQAQQVATVDHIEALRLEVVGLREELAARKDPAADARSALSMPVRGEDAGVV
ncbi:potassium channel family protein [Paeniglutamicibacter cryotolerans]|uniref:Voltage-gated potassium channel n=1 Tax=Paeniglutamicibacter cryotolerans TaxID=670079 RepID=A0A839QSY4_9MICC|nr:potassium channel family protein [Paeniglutamicibacter cryotolerans]MBB2997076.1 voltage-gated potassium channel [Paeniglutamicibacter cryotolerans]